MSRLAASMSSPQRRWLFFIMLLLLITLGFPGKIPLTRGAVLEVNTNDDEVDGNGCDVDHCSLREAINDSNASIGIQDTIVFNLPDLDFTTIQVGPGNLTITDPVIIDGTTQNGADCSAWTPTLLIELDGSNGAPGQAGLVIEAGGSGSTIRGLVINRFDTAGISIRSGSTNNTIECNFIGTDTSGTVALGNNIGIYSAGGGAGNRIGGSSGTAGNVISGNEDEGINLFNVTGFIIEGNYIGTDASGVADLGNGWQGIILDRSDNNTIGGTSEEARNIISGNNMQGIRIQDGANNIVQGNYIGTDVTGTNPLGNSQSGVQLVEGSVDNLIGGTNPGEANRIGFNSAFGVYVNDATTQRNRILGNSIFSNTSLGINIGASSVLPNDPGDGDTGPNNLQNFPVLTEVITDGIETIVTGTLDTAAGTYRVEFFDNEICDDSGNGEGEMFVASTDVTSTGGATDFTFTLPTLVDGGHFLTGTATDEAGNTSEFSACQEVIEGPRYESVPEPAGPPIVFSAVQGMPAQTFIDVNNPGLADLNITDVVIDDTTNFTLLTPTSFSLSAGNTVLSQDIQVQCNALTTTGSPFTTTVTVTHNAPGSPAVYTIECDVTPAPEVDFNSVPAPGDEIDFGVTIINSPLPFYLLIESTGTIGTLLSVTAPADPITGDNAADFTFNPAELPTNLVAGSSAVQVPIQCTPSAVGDRVATLTLLTNDPDEGIVTYPLKCVGIPPVITLSPPTPLPGGFATLSYSETISATGGTPPYTFTVTAGTLPTGFDLAPTGELTGTTTDTGIFNFTITATDTDGFTGDLGYTLTIEPPPTITLSPASPLPDGTAGVAYPTQTITATGGTAPYTFAVTAGTLPTGFDLAATGELTGTTIETGTFNFTVTATDANGFTGELPYQLTVNPPDITLSPASPLPEGTAGVAYPAQTITATGGTEPYTFAVTAGTLPTGFNLAATGELTGTTTDTGTFNFTVTATDDNGFTGELPYQLTVNPPDITLSPASPLPDGTAGVAYPTQTITATGGTEPYTFAVTAGTLPTGFNLAATGELTGTTTDTGTFNFTVTATDANGFTGELPYALTITATPNITLSPASPLPDGTAGVAYPTQTITATGGTEPYTFAVTAGTLPTGFNLASTGELTGTTTDTGTFNFTITATDANGFTGELSYDLTINPPTIGLTPASLPAGTVGVQYDETVTGIGGTAPYTISLFTGTLPPGLSVDSDGEILGTPSQAGSFTFTLRATDANGFAGDFTYTIMINATPTISLAPPSLPNGTIGAIYPTQTITASGGTAPYAFTVTTNALPPGLSLDSTTGQISGTPSQTGTFPFTITVTDATSLTGSMNYSITINPAGGAPGFGSNPAPNSIINLSTPQGVTATATLTISETGDAPLTINSYNLSGGSGALAVSGPTAPFTINDNGQSQRLDITCTSATANTYTGTLTISHNAAGGIATYTVRCVVTPPGTPAYNSQPGPGSTINLGTVQVGAAISTNLLISNPGSGTLTVTLPAGNLLITGVNAADFAIITNSPPFSVQPNNAQTVTVTIRCIPSTAGLLVATLNFQTNVPGQSTVSYGLTCIGSGTAIPTATPVGFIATATPFIATATPIQPATGTVSDEVRGLAMRTGPYLGATLVGGIRPGQAYTILAVNNDESPQYTWYLIIDQNNVTGWVSGRFFNVTGNLPAVPYQGSIFDTLDNAPDIGVEARAMSIIDIRRRPSGRAAILGQIPQGATMSILGRTRQNGGDFWVQIRYNGIVGWIPAAPIDVYGTTANVPIR